MKVDLKSMTPQELEKLQKQLDKEMERANSQKKKEARAAAEKAVKPYGLTLDEVVSGTAPKARKPRGTAKPKAQGKPKYANPADKSETWTGKGRKPNWFLKEVDSGKSPEDMEIK